MVLIGLEIVVPGVSIIWFGISALIVGVLDYFFQLPLVGALLLWIVFGGITLAVMLKYQKKWLKGEGERIDVNRHLVEGKKGIVIEKLDPFFAKAKFEEPILGDREWQVKGENLEVGDIVEVVSVEGNYFKVKKVGHTSPPSS
jgi:membrane protein implicated in regulation of membrane protease activity